jgi:dTDP-4-dehydrorhamnose reductase
VTGWLVTGAGGMLGRDLVDVLGRRGEDVTGLRRGDLDVTDESAVRAFILRARPAVVVNCAAWTAVDDAEAHEDEALLVNGRGAENVAAACAASGSRLVHVSTDYVFGGDGLAPYAEYDRTAPRTAYGRTKLAGEQAVLGLLPETGYVVRTSWLYGAHGPNFVRAMTGLERRQQFVDVVADQRGQPTWAVDVADQIVALARVAPRAGVYHATSSGEATWHELAVEVFRLLGADPARVRATTSAAFPRPAPRPAYSVLGHDRIAAAGVEPIGDWRTALSRAWPVFAAEGSLTGSEGSRAAAEGSRAAQSRGVGQAVGVVRE